MAKKESEVLDGTVIKIPLEYANPETLKKIIAGKESLIKKALGVESLEVEVSKEEISFPWLETTDPDEISAASKLITALCRQSLKQTRVNAASEKEIENEKYAFRCFLLHLGFIGDEYKKDRKILLRNLSGSSAFRKPKEAK